MAAKKKPKPAKSDQSRRFIQTAREIGVDETGEVFERALRSMLRPKNSKKSAQSHD